MKKYHFTFLRSGEAPIKRVIICEVSLEKEMSGLFEMIMKMVLAYELKVDVEEIDFFEVN